MSKQLKKEKVKVPQMFNQNYYSIIEACFYGNMTYSKYYKIRSEYGIRPVMSRPIHIYLQRDVMVALDKFIASEVNKYLNSNHFNKSDNEMRQILYTDLLVDFMNRFRHIEQSVISGMVNNAVDRYIHQNLPFN